MSQQLRKPPKYCQGFEDRHGKIRWYYRRPGFLRVPLPGLPWSPNFMAAYEKATEGEKISAGRSKVIPGSISALVASFYRTSEWKGLGDSTKATYRGIIERFREEHGDKRVAKMERQHVQKFIGTKAETPAAANNLLRMVHLLMRHAVDLDWRRDDPTAGVRKIKNKSEGFATWDETQIDLFLEQHKPGTRAHLAFCLLLYTGQRRSDVVRMGRQHVRDGALTIIQQKTGQEVTVPVHPLLATAIAAVPRDNLAFLTTAQGKPFSPAGFTNWFRDMVREVKGLPSEGLSAHGLRKAICRRLAEAGCTPHEIMAISGHKSLQEVTRYTAKASRVRMAQTAMAAIGGSKEEQTTVKPALEV